MKALKWGSLVFTQRRTCSLNELHRVCLHFMLNKSVNEPLVLRDQNTLLCTWFCHWKGITIGCELTYVTVILIKVEKRMVRDGCGDGESGIQEDTNGDLQMHTVYQQILCTQTFGMRAHKLVSHLPSSSIFNWDSSCTQKAIGASAHRQHCARPFHGWDLGWRTPSSGQVPGPGSPTDPIR